MYCCVVLDVDADTLGREGSKCDAFSGHVLHVVLVVLSLSTLEQKQKERERERECATTIVSIIPKGKQARTCSLPRREMLPHTYKQTKHISSLADWLSGVVVVTWKSLCFYFPWNTYTLTYGGPLSRDWYYPAVETKVAKVFSYFFLVFVVAKTLLPGGTDLPW